MIHDGTFEPMPDTLGDMAAQIARKLAADQDLLIRECITEQIGEAWEISDVFPRLRWEQERGRPEKVLTLDGKAILVIWPPNSTTSDESGAMLIKWSVQYQKL